MKNYISKINDRNLQRRRESGFTTYAFYTVLILVIFKICDDYSSIPFEKKFWETFTILSCTFNFAFATITTLLVYEVTLGHISSIRFISKPSNDKLFEIFINYSLFLLPLSFNIVNALHILVNENNYNLYHLVHASFLLLINILYLTFTFYEKRKLNKTYRIFEGTGKTGTDKDVVSIATYLLCILSIVSSFVVMYDVALPNNLQVFLFGFLIYSFPIIIQKIIDLRKNDLFANALENLEYEINIRNLNDEEIKKRLQDKYMGYLLINWVTQIQDESDLFKTETNNLKTEIKLLIANAIDAKSKNYQFEFEGLVDIINKKHHIHKTSIENYYNSKLDEIENIWNSERVESEERVELSHLYNKLKTDYKQLTDSILKEPILY